MKVKFQGKIITKGSGTSLKYLDQLTEKLTWISRSFMARYLSRNYDLSIQEYYNLVVFDDKDFTPKCICGRHRKFWRLINGYYTTCAQNDCISILHSKSNHERWDSMSENERLEFSSKLGYASKEGLRIMCQGCYSRFIALGNESDICEFYIASTFDGQFKFGISEDSLSRKSKMSYKKVKVIKCDTRVNIAKLEYDIKIKLNSPKEYLPWSEVHNFIKIFNSLT